ncbi:hypothetical protein CBS101457_006294 [Exobasidium rhododendri]|nr:hypothetical protein CBS101457_006294 [Exobasidium rhododendri]
MSNKRKASMHEEPSFDGEMTMDDYDSDGAASDTRKGSSKPGETVVTKRTLQNRKAQREFRKRREARVRDLEERCRRFDQMGLEANIELQRVARNLKEENEALRGFVIRIGYGNMMPSILDGVGHNNASNDNNSFLPAFGGGFGGANDGTKSSEDDGNDLDVLNQQSLTGHRRDKMTGSAKMPYKPFHGSKTSSWEDNSSNNYSAISNKQSTNEGKDSPSGSSEISSSSSHNAPLLSLKLSRADKQQQEEQRQPVFTTTSNDVASQSQMMPDTGPSISSMSSLLGQMNTQMSNANADGSGMAGSAMLGGFQMPYNSFAPYTVPQRTQKNEALLNPNPIPFSFNLSNEPTQAMPSWWDQMGGGRFTPGNETSELDEKAQAVAAAQINNGGPQSPFDLSAFLQGGMTPGGGYSFANATVPDDFGIKNKGLATSQNNDSKDTDHMRMFVQLLEKKVAEREAHTVASLGFQPPSQDPSQRRSGMFDDADQKPKVSFSSALSPTGVYSRLSRHPAFLSTDARELEELVDALGNGASRSPTERKNPRGYRDSITGTNQVSSPNYLNRIPSTATNIKRSPSSSNASGSSNATAHHSSFSSHSSANSSNDNSNTVEIDERAIDRLMGLLDQKTIVGGKANDLGQGEPLSMAMT